MGTDLPISLIREGFGVVAAVGAPFLGALLVVGLIVGVIQAPSGFSARSSASPTLILSSSSGPSAS